MTYAELYEQAKLYSSAFRRHGLVKGDRVVCYMPNREEPVLAMLATVSVGAIWAGALPLLGAQAVLKKFSQLSPKFLITIDRFKNENLEIEMFKKIKEITDALPSLEKVIIVPSKEISKSKNISDIRNSCFLDEFLALGRLEDGSVPEMEFEQVPFAHPVCINFTSGTTGPPKPVMHGCAPLLSISRDFHIHCDAERGSVWFSISPVGWASWMMFCSMAFNGLTVVLYEGVPYFLNPEFVIWDLIDRFGITHLFLPAGVVDELEKRKVFPTEKHHLRSLETFMGGGSVVKPQSYDYVYKCVPKRTSFCSAYGGTELMGSCLMLERTLPVHRGELTAPSLGVKLATLDDNGQEVVGQMGNLTITNPAPNLPCGLYGDADGSVYREKYFHKDTGYFILGDYAIINPKTNGVVICCRSDETLKQRGTRFGSAEIYNVVDLFPEVRDSLCVSKYAANMDEHAVLFLRMRDGHVLDAGLESRVRSAIARELSPEHVPDLIVQTWDIPVNLNGKKMEILAKRVINKMTYNADTISNPDCLEFYKKMADTLLSLCPATN